MRSVYPTQQHFRSDSPLDEILQELTATIAVEVGMESHVSNRADMASNRDGEWSVVDVLKLLHYGNRILPLPVWRHFRLPIRYCRKSLERHPTHNSEGQPPFGCPSAHGHGRQVSLAGRNPHFVFSPICQSSPRTMSRAWSKYLYASMSPFFPKFRMMYLLRESRRIAPSMPLT